MTKTDRRKPSHSVPHEVESAVQAAESKQADDLVLLDLRAAAAFTDFFLICSGHNARQIRAIADSIIDTLKASGARPAHVEGYERSDWVLLDYFDFVVHIFTPEMRVFFGLERLWGSAVRVELSDGKRRRTAGSPPDASQSRET